jgi:AmiR/NasT family two-component response regulator
MSDQLSEEGKRQPLRVLIANESRERLKPLATTVLSLGHEVIAREIEVAEVGAVTAREQPDVAIVGLGLDSEHALDMVSKIVHEAACPVVAILSAKNPAFVREAASRGVFAYLVEDEAEDLQSAIEVTPRRFAEYQSLQGAFGRRALIEQAKGILMATHRVNADRAFEMLRAESRQSGRKIIDLATAVVASQSLLAPTSAISQEPAVATNEDDPSTDPAR